jgi:hypothetical protein
MEIIDDVVESALQKKKKKFILVKEIEQRNGNQV